MRIALVLTPMSDHHLRLASQVGVTDIVARYPGTELDALLKLRDHIASFGMRLTIVEKNPRANGSECVIFGHIGRDGGYVPVTPAGSPGEEAPP